MPSWEGPFEAVDSFDEAQAIVPFPVHRPPGELETIAVRRNGPASWPSVRSVHRWGDARFRVKQFAYDLLAYFGWPQNLWFREGEEAAERWDTYGRTTHLDVGPPSAFRGKDWEGAEAASLYSLGTHVEVRTLEGTLGPELTRDLLLETAGSVPPAARLLAARPLSEWNWTLRSGDSPRYRRPPVPHGIVWEAARGPTHPPSLEGWALSDVGFGRAPHHAGDHYLLYRSSDRHSVLSVARLAGAVGARTGDLLRPRAPLFETVGGAGKGDAVEHLRSSAFGVEVLHSTFPGGAVQAVVPTGTAVASQDFERLVEWARSVV
jgi:hypothetical protein